MSWTIKSTTHNLRLLIAFILIILLSSCSHTRSDGPPGYNVDVSKIPNAVPKPEPLAKYGNNKSYVVFGKKYHTMSSSKNYNEVGVASWYGSKFHDRKTSSGEPYNMLSMTAAHKTLPLPTYVEVTNLNNDKKIIVKVNDRGPFASDRIIDLSYVAAKKLGMLGHGTANVRVRAINPYALYNREPLFSHSQPIKSPWVNIHKNKMPSETIYPAFRPVYKTVASKQTRQHFVASKQTAFLQVGAFRNKNHAMKLQQRLKTLSSAPVNVIHPSTKGKLYRVKIGPFRDLATMTKMTHRLNGLGIKSSKV